MKATKKLIGAAVALVAAASLTVGSTFAWFTSKQNVDMEEVSFKVTSGDPTLMMAVLSSGYTSTDLTNATFKYQLEDDDIYNALGGTDNVVYNHMTTNDNGKHLLTKSAFDTSATSTDYATYNTSATSANPNSFAEFVLVFRTNKKSAELHLDSTSTIASASTNATPADIPTVWSAVAGSAATVYGTELGNVGTAISADAKNAARVSFVVDSTSRVWAPNEDVGSLTAADVSDKGAGFYIKNLASEYYKHIFPSSPAALTSTYITEDNDTYRVYAKGTGDLSDKNKIATFGDTVTTNTQYYQMIVTVKVWLEGRDGDCFNSILNQDLKFKLAFAIK